MNQDTPTQIKDKLRPLPRWIFMSRWLQAPLYMGLIVAQIVYVIQFWRELVHLIGMMMTKGGTTETEIMLIVLGLIDVVMISNLLVMVIVGGWETFVSRLELKNHPDQPSVQEKGCWALKNLVANTDNHMKIVNADVMNLILTSMQKHWDHADVQEQGCLVILRFLHISKHNNDISHQVKIVDEGGIIDVIISAMQNHSDHIGIKNAGNYVLNILFGN